jgi:uncharacterized protein with GYD domain
MARYVVLLKWTDQGVKNADKTIERATAGKQAFEKGGGRLTEILWCLGPYDMICQCEAPDDETMTALALGLAKQGNVKTTTLRAFTENDMQKIIKKSHA